MAEVVPKIGLLHHTSGSNLGDGGSVDAVMQNIKRRWPDAALFGFSMNPEDTRTRHGVPSYPLRRRIWNFGSSVLRAPQHTAPSLRQKAKAALRRHPLVFSTLRALSAVTIRMPGAFVGEILFLIHSFSIIKTFDLLVVTGGGQFVESTASLAIFGGPWEFPYTMFKWILLAKVAHVRSEVVNVGVGPLTRPLSKWFVRRTLALADYVSFRDEESRAVAHRIGSKRKSEVFPDNMYALNIPAQKTDPLSGRTRPLVGFAPMAYGDPRLSSKHDPDMYICFVKQLGLFGGWLRQGGYDLMLFCSDISIDPPAVEDVRRIILQEDRGGVCPVHRWPTTEELLANMSSMDYAVTCRFHPVVFAHMLNIPVLAIAHHPKVRALMEDLGLADYCVDIDDCNSTVLARRFSSLVDNRDEVKSRMADKLASYRKRLSVQFDELFPSHGVMVDERHGGFEHAFMGSARMLGGPGRRKRPPEST